MDNKQTVFGPSKGSPEEQERLLQGLRSQVPPRKPYVGETVLFTPNPGDTVAKSNYNNDDVAAIVTRVWGAICINIKLIPDCGPMQDRTSVIHQSQNPAGYHFRFIGEEKVSTNEKMAVNSEEIKDASSFLAKAKEQLANLTEEDIQKTDRY